MVAGKIIIALGFILMLICSCNAGIKNLPGLYGKKLYTPYRHMIGRNELIIFADSTFAYTGAGGALYFSAGKWKINDKKSIILTSRIYNMVPGKQLIDTIFINFDNRIIKIKARDKVELNYEVFTRSDSLIP